MRWFEVSDSITEGCRLGHGANGPGIPMGIDAETGVAQYIEFGNSLTRLLKHPDDYLAGFRLHWAGLTQGPSPCAVAQTQEEAIADGKAIVLLDRAYDEDAGVTKVAEAWQRGRPDLLRYVVSRGLVRAMYLFSKGNGLYVKHPRSMGDMRFEMVWDGATLVMNVREQKAPRREPTQLAWERAQVLTA